MPSRNRKKRSRERYKADPEKKKASVRDTYNANAVSKRAAKRQRYQEDVEENRAAKRQRYQEGVEENRAAKRQRYQEDVEENHAAKRQKYEDNSDAIKASKRNRYWNDPAVRLAKRAAERKRFRMGHRTTTTTQSYSLYEPKSHALMEYNGGLEKAILRDSELLSEVNALQPNTDLKLICDVFVVVDPRLSLSRWDFTYPLLLQKEGGREQDEVEGNERSINGKVGEEGKMRETREERKVRESDGKEVNRMAIT
eukprot:Em0013g768a